MYAFGNINAFGPAAARSSGPEALSQLPTVQAVARRVVSEGSGAPLGRRFELSLSGVGAPLPGTPLSLNSGFAQC